ncbi:MAG TPA: LytTR family DNA-binding domain-containing protein [Saprospiraceae bacterium]|nr:LytTR family DNA-binding domain-containing protein [Saprospiraceae bacterium]HPN68993.1 LytTR family DNA-binding domain-containing protein [Saprospiraceae bacterium]
MINILIVDDELMATKTLTLMIQKSLEIKAEIKAETDFQKALLLVDSFKPDLIMLDIMMPPHTGFEFLSQCRHRNFVIIFTTAFDHYAIKAIKFSALDYLLKPIAATELKEALNRFLIMKSNAKPELYNHLLDNLRMTDSKQYTLAIPTLEKIHFIDISQLIRCESDSNYTWFYLQNGSKIIASKTMKHFEPILLEHQFVRIHRSHLVNRKFMDAIHHQEILVLKDGTSLPLSRSRKNDLLG